ncbi:MAG: hypothetical protein OQJ96_02330 [Flavobacteriales bacterium]|nr:hypothetical protein [Flavobacteriales bacterium]MCW8912762.1 hypothetical protein [Flavobacteriales bacterium]MCW8936873.1 hypothetical protein [Flavobacteriales bacterium]MCW8939233.1 hypothetical protein [Flavobacteriales bacterium]MCW8968070.1 hypothetical protein [Flavobacteriales bacterium]
MINKLNLILGLTILFFLYACAPVYFPNKVNSPMINKAGDYNIEATMGVTGFDVQTAYSPIEKLGVMANFSTFDGSDHFHSFFEGGLGYYEPLGSKGLFEIYGGYGYGNSRTSTQGIFGTINKGNYSRYFIQPSIGLITMADNESGVAGSSYFTPRFCFVDFGSDNKGYYVEPVVGTRIGWRRIQINLQMGFSLPTSEVKIDHAPFIFNFGLSYVFKKIN